jgi:integrase
MALYKRGGVWWYSFIFAGKRVQESAKTSRKTIAAEAEKNRRLELERTLAGIPVEKKTNRISSVADVVGVYRGRYEIDHRERPQSVLFSRGRLAHITRLLGNALLPDVTQDVVRGYIKTRLEDGASGRTINMELGELSRAIGKPWSILWPKVRKQEERKNVGKALSAEQEARLTEAGVRSRSQIINAFVRVALLTGMRSGENRTLTWEQVDFSTRIVTVGRAKSECGTGRQIPMNEELFQVLSAHAEWYTKRFGEAKPEYYLFPFGKPTPNDPTRPISDISSAWETIREAAGVNCRLHDLRHTVATKMAEAGVPESTMLALLGHMSRAMLERYSHIRMVAKRQAVEALSTRPKPQSSDSISTISTTTGATARFH